MANNIFWGQGANTNVIGWGQGAINNIINWGKIYFTSYTGDTDIVGNDGALANEFIARVIADSGVFEAKDCLLLTLQNLDTI